VDPSGAFLETAWDAFNITLGVYSLQNNVRQGNWGSAALDAVGLAYDGVATAVPFLPAGVSSGLQAYRAGNTVVNSAQVGLDVARVANVANDATRAANRTSNAAQEGSRVHSQVSDAIESRNLVSNSARNNFSGANGATGPRPDMAWDNAPGVWMDLTTPGQWSRHVSRYGSTFGDGIPMLYERGVGLLDSTKLYSGAGTLLGVGQSLSDFSSINGATPYSGTGAASPRLGK
jgi:hypothetical protein